MMKTRRRHILSLLLLVLPSCGIESGISNEVHSPVLDDSDIADESYDGRNGINHDKYSMTMTPALPSFLFLLIDDVGWADFGYNNGTAKTPNIDRWASRAGSMKLYDFHSGGTVCSPTRATVLTGRHHFRDCVDRVYGCDDMTGCVPDFEFAPSKTYTVGDAIRSMQWLHNTSDYDDGIFFAGKWHLGSFYNDSEHYGGITSSPKTHGFDHYNATVEVAPTATSNCRCKEEWKNKCNFGHYGEPTHCSTRDRRCCFNYWWDDPLQPHGVMNLTWPVPEDDSLYLVDSFERFLSSRLHCSSDDCDGESSKKIKSNRPFLAQISFHNCHKPFIGTSESVSACAKNETCRPPSPDDPTYTSLELDYYACLSQLDHAVGKVLGALEQHGYYDNTMIWFTSDNGPEENCPPTGVCQRANTHPQRPVEGPGSAGPLRGRKRDIFEGGHRVPGIISWPARIPSSDDGGGLESWETIVTTDFLPTIMDILDVERPHHQRSWAMDGRSILPILDGITWAETPEGPRSFGLGFSDPHMKIANGWGYRHGKWKYVVGSVSCQVDSCDKEQLYDLDTDVGERHDLSLKHPETMNSLRNKFFDWHASVLQSRTQESKCKLQSESNMILPQFLEELLMEKGDTTIS